MNLSDFDYELPKELIAQEPLVERSASRLMVVDRENRRIEHRKFKDIIDYLSPDDCLTLNDTRVLPARLFGRKTTGARVEIFLLRELNEYVWETLCRPARRLALGAEIIFNENLKARIVKVLDEGRRLVEFSSPLPLKGQLWKVGRIPLPPYIHKNIADDERYQTVYAVKEGSVAAPTAGLHLTPQLLAEIERRDVNIAKLTLEIGIDTFRPVKVEKVQDHTMHSEKYSLSVASAKIINDSKACGGKVVAVGTTSVRVLESSAVENGQVRSGSGETKLYIFPGYKFRLVDRLITNFHLPCSTLLILVCAFADREFIMSAYREAIKEGYRFFSFGDAMLIL